MQQFTMWVALCVVKCCIVVSFFGRCLCSLATVLSLIVFWFGSNLLFGCRMEHHANPAHLMFMRCLSKTISNGPKRFTLGWMDGCMGEWLNGWIYMIRWKDTDLNRPTSTTVYDHRPPSTTIDHHRPPSTSIDHHRPPSTTIDHHRLFTVHYFVADRIKSSAPKGTPHKDVMKLVSEKYKLSKAKSKPEECGSSTPKTVLQF